jgi:hypothetical protein
MGNLNRWLKPTAMDKKYKIPVTWKSIAVRFSERSEGLPEWDFSPSVLG